MATFVVSIIAPCGKTHQPRCPGTQDSRMAPYPALGQSADPRKVRPVPSPRPRSFQVRLEAEDAHLGAKLPLDCSEITLRLRDR